MQRWFGITFLNAEISPIQWMSCMKRQGEESLRSGIPCEQVFEVEDADGPVEGAEQDSIAARFGRLKVADASNVGLPGEQLAVLADAQRALAAEPTGIEADLNLWRQHLGISPAAGGLIFWITQEHKRVKVLCECDI